MRSLWLNGDNNTFYERTRKTRTSSRWQLHNWSVWCGCECTRTFKILLFCTDNGSKSPLVRTLHTMWNARNTIFIGRLLRLNIWQFTGFDTSAVQFARFACSKWQIRVWNESVRFLVTDVVFLLLFINLRIDIFENKKTHVNFNFSTMEDCQEETISNSNHLQWMKMN